MTEHSKHAEAHIDSIVKQEEEALEKRSYSERLADRVGTFAGSFAFVAFHLNLQIDLLAEKEITTLLQMVRAICGHMGLQSIVADREIRELSKNTSIESLSRTLEDRLSGA
jgi:uncharacterized membrane protein